MDLEALPARAGPSTEVSVVTVERGERRTRTDALATEEPLEIRLRAADKTESVGVSMRTPGNDFELAAGFLFAEGIISGPGDLRTISYCVDRALTQEQRYNVVTVTLNARTLPALGAAERRFVMSSACGVCGRATIDALHERALAPIALSAPLDPAILHVLPERLREGQRIFALTGGLHAAGLFSPDGTLLAIREDIGRHNALDKLIGWALLERRLPLRDHIVAVSGRVGYELVQKAVCAGIPVVCAVSAPSSLAVSLAREFDVTLIGFMRDTRFNI
ncbi:MAG TPA: formate dehydrogenase accessory sulfurtransferase FdhD, partial [Candidatus Baltobacteraceae bacterium]